jgi:type I restriction enzyme S subunit
MEWKEYQIQDVCRLINGRAYSNDEMLEHGKYKIVRVGNLSGGNSTWFYSDLELPADKYCHNGDLLFAWACTFGPHIWKEDNTIFHYHIWKIVEDKDVVDRRFFYYYLKFATGGFLGALNGSVMVHITKSSMEKMIIRIPKKLDDQRRIASILSSLDRKIEMNNKINADLEEMAQAIFKNWFVDFEPFKDGKFVDSELGMIPEGWKVSQIADIPHILETGKRPKGGAVEKGIPSVGAEHVKGMCAYDYSKTKYINCEFAAKLKTGKINGYELMIYKDGGKPGYFIPNFSIFGEGYPFENCYLNEHVFKLDFDGNKEFNIFCYFFFKTEQIMSYFNAQGAKAAIPGINKKDVENIYIFTPDNESVIKFGEFAYPLFKQMLKNAIENRTLSLLRDTLLPRLMSGELEVPE